MPDLRQLVARAPWWLIAIAAAYLYVFPFYPRLQSANELPRVYLVKAIVDDHTFAIDHGVQRWGRTSDLAQWGDHLYSNKAPGSSLLAVPAYALVRWIAGEPSFTVIIWICRIVTGVIPTLLSCGCCGDFSSGSRRSRDPATRARRVRARVDGDDVLAALLLASAQRGVHR